MSGFPKPVRDLIRARSDGRCERCGIYPGVQIHHRRPRGAGGSTAPDTNTASNGLHLCFRCHSQVESKRDMALALGYLVRQGQSPSEVPVFRFGQWALLNDNGTTTETTRGS